MSAIEIYTDGTCSPNPGPGGWGFHYALGGKSTHEYGWACQTTNNRMEMYAAIAAMRMVDEQQELIIYSDSQMMIKCVTGKWKRNLNLDLWKEMDEAVNLHRHVHWRWVKGHDGNAGNEAANALAVHGRNVAAKFARDSSRCCGNPECSRVAATTTFKVQPKKAAPKVVRTKLKGNSLIEDFNALAAEDQDLVLGLIQRLKHTHR